MGWVEMLGWLEQMNRQRTGAEPDPDRWNEASEANFADLRAARDRRLGRT